MGIIKILFKKPKMPDGYSKSEQTCCLCFPLATGMKVLGYVMMIDVIIWLVQVIYAFVMDPIAAVVYILILFVPLFAAFKWFQWLKDDNEKTTGSLVTAMRILFFYMLVVGLIMSVVFSLFIGLLITLLSGGTGGNKEEATTTGLMVGVWFSYFINVFSCWYFYNATKRYYQDRHVA